ncbi:pyridoxal phosphate-dependent aminotransferase [Pseudacidobacterium ailaaui]|uniref:pyridoxal phosphate-dependent aminotransferase n=1 Tax=Pseudacidobacterium ailaaui TaxID=1382359 RepID=UPI000A67B439
MKVQRLPARKVSSRYFTARRMARRLCSKMKAMQFTTEKLRPSQISPHIVQSEIRAMTVECDRVGGVNLAQGVCDTGVPSPVIEAAIQAIHDGRNIYTRLDGIAPLREAIARKLERYNKILASPDDEILVTSGATGALYAACLALLDPGDEVVLFEPFYGYHVNTLLSLRIKPVPVPLLTHHWEIDFERLRAAITPRTRALILNSPSNPCGKVFTQGELQQIAELVLEHNLFLFTDEIYEYFLFDGTQHLSPASLPGMARHTITISGLSKTFSMTGWRIGYLAADKRWMGPIAYFHDLTYVCAPSPFQYGAAAGLMELPDSFYQDLSAEYQKKRDMLCAALSHAGFSPSIPQGAYYVLADVSPVPGRTAREKARNLLASTSVAAVAGTAFFSQGRGEELLRFCFAKKDEDLQRACDLLRQSRP